MRQKLGQHFLHSSGVLERIAAAACPEGCRLVVEIGPGRGALTEYLLRRAKLVKAIEFDPELAQELNERWGSERKFNLIPGDALRTDWSAFGPGLIAGNLPYYAATAIISGAKSGPVGSQGVTGDEVKFSLA